MTDADIARLPAVDVGGRNPWQIAKAKADRLARLRQSDAEFMALAAQLMKHL